VVDKKDFPENLQWNAASIWGGPNCHLVHYPLRGGEQYNVVVTVHSREKKEWGVTDGSKEEVQSYFQGIAAKPRQLIDLPKALALYQKSRVAPTARIVLSGREMGRLYHAKGVERLVRNDLWKGRSAERFYDAMEWLYGWNVGNCLAAE
jgi:salicylate hydroxylase